MLATKLTYYAIENPPLCEIWLYIDSFLVKRTMRWQLFYVFSIAVDHQVASLYEITHLVISWWGISGMDYI